MFSLNPLKSGPVFRSDSEGLVVEVKYKSQSPQIGASLQIQVIRIWQQQQPCVSIPSDRGQSSDNDTLDHLDNLCIASQSPQIGACLQIDYGQVEMPVVKLSQSPQIGACLQIQALNTA